MEKNDNSLKIMSYYHTSIRNIGLYLSLSFAALVGSRYHRGKNFTINILMILVSIVFSIISYLIGLYLIQDIEVLNSKDPVEIIEKWLIIPNVTQIINIAILLGSIYVLFTQLVSQNIKSN